MPKELCSIGPRLSGRLDPPNPSYPSTLTNRWIVSPVLAFSRCRGRNSSSEKYAFQIPCDLLASHVKNVRLRRSLGGAFSEAVLLASRVKNARLQRRLENVFSASVLLAYNLKKICLHRRLCREVTMCKRYLQVLTISNKNQVQFYQQNQLEFQHQRSMI